MLVDSHPRSLHRCPIGFNSLFWLSHLGTFRVVLKPLLGYVCCVLGPLSWKVGRLTVCQFWSRKHSGKGYQCASLHSSFLQFQPVLSLQLGSSPQHDAATTVPHCRDSIRQVMSSARCSSQILLRIKIKKFYFRVIRPQNFIFRSCLFVCLFVLKNWFMCFPLRRGFWWATLP